jgi:radical SAM superfamily enzyme YgiQ (UPF0313 family)
LKVLLVKCHKETVYSIFEPIVCEPLELEYIAYFLNKKNIEYNIMDYLLDGKDFKKEYKGYRPDVVMFSGYITAVDVILEYSKIAKCFNCNVKIIVGGVHAELNYSDFFSQYVDFVAHQSNPQTIEEIVSSLKQNFERERHIESIKGIAYKKNEKWVINDKNSMEEYKLPIPDRSFFNKYKSKTRYMMYRGVAILKTSIACPYKCEFCYCRKINKGKYLTRDLKDVIDEIKSIESEYIWIVDDTFLIDRERILRFISMVKSHGIRKKFIAYSRVDFIAENSEIIKMLKDIGFVEIICGVEDIKNQRLDKYNKGTTESNNEKAIKVLKDLNIRVTPLFIAYIDFTLSDFSSMKRWIRKNNFESYTMSVFTPMKGTDEYEKYKDKLVIYDSSKYDFMHLVMNPLNMSRLMFYLYFYSFYIEQIFRSRYIRKFIFSKFFKENRNVK